MNIDEYQTLFLAATLAFILIAATPTISMVISIPKTEEPFSEIWVLGPNHTVEDLPYNITIGEQKLLYIGVGNHLGFSAYYTVYLKLRNQTQPLPEPKNATPSSLLPLYEFRFFLNNDANWEMLVNFAIQDASIRDDNLVLEQIFINNVVFEVEYATTRSSKLLFQFFFELWLYNATSGKFQYHNRFASVWLKLM